MFDSKFFCARNCNRIFYIIRPIRPIVFLQQLIGLPTAIHTHIIDGAIMCLQS